jgi:hypothetical protein
VFWDTSTFITRFVPPCAGSLMEKNITGKRMVEIRNSFEHVWKSICEKNIELETDSGTPFVARAVMAKRRGSSDLEEALVFLKNDVNGKLKECSRCYQFDWGRYFNSLGREGQRIGMYCKVVDFVAL